jgi:hypothetical protein
MLFRLFRIVVYKSLNIGSTLRGLDKNTAVVSLKVILHVPQECLRKARTFFGRIVCALIED